MTTLHRQQGFTLVEVITVMLVLVAIASVTVESSKDFVFQNRYDITKDRYEKIKKAIIGDPNQVINGQPNIEGFVKDVGRPPLNIHELLEGNYCSSRWKEVAGIKQYNSDETTCTNDGFSWISVVGWKKAYITSNDAPLHDNAFSDGWGNTATNADDHNYGWIYKCLDSSNNTVSCDNSLTTQVRIQSKGKDQNIGMVTTDIYDADYPNNQPAIRESDWKVDISQLRFLIKSNNTGLAPNIKVKTSNLSSPSNVSTIVEDGTQRLTSFSYVPSNTSNIIPMGNVNIGIYYDDEITKYPISFPFICKNTASHSNFTQANCENVTNGGIWKNISGINYCYGLSEALKCTGTTSPELGGSLQPETLCADTNNSANFTQANCEGLTNGGIWKEVAGKKYCFKLDTDVKCTGTTSPELGGTLNLNIPKSDITITLSPNTTLPTINW